MPIIRTVHIKRTGGKNISKKLNVQGLLFSKILNKCPGGKNSGEIKRPWSYNRHSRVWFLSSIQKCFGRST